MATLHKWLYAGNDDYKIKCINRIERKAKKKESHVLHWFSATEAYILSLLCSNNLKSHKNLQVNENSSL